MLQQQQSNLIVWPEVTFGSSSLSRSPRWLLYIISTQAVYILCLKVFNVTQTSLLLCTNVLCWLKRIFPFYFTLIFAILDHYTYIPSQTKSFPRFKKKVTLLRIWWIHHLYGFFTRVLLIQLLDWLSQMYWALVLLALQLLVLWFSKLFPSLSKRADQLIAICVFFSQTIFPSLFLT